MPCCPSKTDTPTSDQGFGSKPFTLESRSVTGMKPMAALQGQALGGALGRWGQSRNSASNQQRGGGECNAWHHIEPNLLSVEIAIRRDR